VVRRLRAFSLFSGAGGLDLGVETAAYRVEFAIENDPVAVATLNLNREQYFPRLPEVSALDITKLEPRLLMQSLRLEPGEIDLLVGGPPCVAFSKSGFHLEYKREGRDERAYLLDDYLRFLDALRPKTYLMENVFGLAYQNQSKAWFKRLRQGILRLGYSFKHDILNAADYGVPQNRQRLFIIGATERRNLAFPEITHWGEHERRKPPKHAEKLLPHVTAGEALEDLHTEAESEELVNGRWGHLLPEIPPGRNYLHFPAKAEHPSPLFGWRTRYWTFLLKLDRNRPSSTIQAQPGPYVGPFHWENRRLRAPELKRLQGFPLDYQLAGTRRDVQRQIGNSVPPPLVAVVAGAITQQLAGSASQLLSESQLEFPELAAV